MRQYDVDKAITYISDELLSKFAFVGTPDQITEQALQLFEAGATRIEFGTPHELTTENGLTLLGDIVLPNVRAIVSDTEFHSVSDTKNVLKARSKTETNQCALACFL